MSDIYVTTNNIHIGEGYLVGHRSFRDVLLRLKTEDCMVYKRSMWSLECEWAVRNVLYKLGLFRSHTKDVDLHYPNRCGWLYVMLGTLCYPFA